MKTAQIYCICTTYCIYVLLERHSHPNSKSLVCENFSQASTLVKHNLSTILSLSLKASYVNLKNYNACVMPTGTEQCSQSNCHVKLLAVSDLDLRQNCSQMGFFPNDSHIFLIILCLY